MRTKLVHEKMLFMVELLVADWAASLAWYRDSLGIHVALTDPAGGFALLESGDTRLALKHGQPTPGGVKLYFQVPQLDAELARLAALGVVPTQPPDRSPEGYRRAVLADPDGYAVGLFAWVDPE